VLNVDKGVLVYDARPVTEVLSKSMMIERYYLRILGIFAALALLLAAIGIYGVMSYSVSERNHAIGVRMALGARPGQIVSLLLKESLILAVLGMLIGVGASFAATPVLANMLYGVKAHDPLTLTLVSLFLLAIAALATFVPARRASRIDPMASLRQE
jgi:putative ABC transport system permease protein